MYRDEKVAVLERVARLEDRVRDLDPQTEADKKKKRRRLGVAFGLAALLSLAGTATALYLLGCVEGQTVMHANAGQVLTVRFGTTVRDVRWFDAEGVERAPLVLPDYLQRGNDPVQASSTLIVPDERVSARGPTSFVVTYRAFGLPRRANVSFDAKVTDVETTRRLLAGLPPWVAFSKHEAPLLYFSTLLAYKYALEAITWGIGDGPLDRSVHFAPSTVPGIDRDDEIYVTLPASVRNVRVKLRYKDGSESETRSFDREHDTLR